MRGATDGVQCADTTSAISIHAPHAGCDVFHPVRQRVIVHISIHAPHAGCDILILFPVPPMAGFQSTHPMRGATWEKKMSAESRTFQSTHPMRGATDTTGTPSVQVTISIHAPHAGCDRRLRHGPIFGEYFNPRTPCGVRPAGRLRRLSRHYISIHAPHAGCDVRPWPAAIGALTFQSTHPMRGATGRIKTFERCGYYFNPRTPCGVRHREYPRRERGRRNFNPRTPCGVRPVAATETTGGNIISIHAPHAGCDVIIVKTGSLDQNFNPRTPCGVRQDPTQS